MTFLLKIPEAILKMMSKSSLLCIRLMAHHATLLPAEERCVTSQKTDASETSQKGVKNNKSIRNLQETWQGQRWCADTAVSRIPRRLAICVTASDKAVKYFLNCFGRGKFSM